MGKIELRTHIFYSPDQIPIKGCSLYIYIGVRDAYYVGDSLSLSADAVAEAIPCAQTGTG